MTLEVLFTCLLIVAARIGDVSLGTIRTVSVINGRRGVAWALGFVEVLLWILVVSRVINEAKDNTYYAIAYALGFATGNFIGITIEQHLAFGEQVLRVFTRKGPELAQRLRGHGHRVTEFDGKGRDGPVAMLFIQTARKRVPDVLEVAKSMDSTFYYVIDDVRAAAAATSAPRKPGGLLSVMKRK